MNDDSSRLLFAEAMRVKFSENKKALAAQGAEPITLEAMVKKYGAKKPPGTLRDKTHVAAKRALE